MRIFIALDIPDEIRGRMTEYIERVRGSVPEARWARVEGLHVTLKFVGEVSDAKVHDIKEALTAAKAAPFDVTFDGVGFFPSLQSPRVFWIGVVAGDPLPQLALAIDDATHKLGIAKEERAYNPHLTLARAGSGAAARHQLKPLVALVASRLHSELRPQFGTMTAREFFMYRSELARGGARYTKLERFGMVEE